MQMIYEKKVPDCILTYEIFVFVVNGQVTEGNSNSPHHFICIWMEQLK